MVGHRFRCWVCAVDGNSTPRIRPGSMIRSRTYLNHRTVRPLLDKAKASRLFNKEER
jgi:hypothetical protein